MITPFNDFTYLVNHVLLGEEPTIEDFILLVGTLVAFVAFILWCCFPIQPKDSLNRRQFSCKGSSTSSLGDGGGAQLQQSRSTYSRTTPTSATPSGYLLRGADDYTYHSCPG